MKSNSLRALVVLATVFCSVMAFGQAADRINNKIRRVYLLNQILPVLMTPAQIKKILPTVESARNAEKFQLEHELDVMKKYEAKIDTAIQNGLKKKMLTTGELKDELRLMLDTLGAERAKMIRVQSDKVREIMEQVLDKGQLKAATNSFDVRWFDPSADPAKYTDEQKLRLFIRMVILDPEAYPLLVEMSKES